MASIKQLPLPDRDKGIELSLPTKGSTNWAEDFENYFAIAIRDHDHSGDGRGAEISAVVLGVGTMQNVDIVGKDILQASTVPVRVDSLSDTFKVGAGESLIIEYTLTGETGPNLTPESRAGTVRMTAFYDTGTLVYRISDEFVGSDLTVDFVVPDVSSANAGQLCYLNLVNINYKMKYFIRKVRLG